MCTVYRLQLLRLLLLLGFPSFSTQAGTPSEVTISTFPIGDDPLFIMCRKVLEEAYRRVGIRLHMVYLPGERSLQFANEGRTDGDLCRKKGVVQEQYKNLLMLGPALAHAEIVAFSRRSLNVRKWSDLRHYTIGYELGVKVVEENTAGMKTDTASNMELGFKKLFLGRTDVWIDNRLSGLYMLQKLGYKGFHVSPPFAVHTMHHYLNERHIAILPKLEAALIQMKKDGTLVRIENSMVAQ